MLLRLFLIFLALLTISTMAQLAGSPLSGTGYIRSIRYPIKGLRPFGYGGNGAHFAQRPPIGMPSQSGAYERFGGSYGPGLLTGMLLGK
ncbi:unnamed protein product, partial [Mesorhabditis belari]|uniref:Uncharacterized protein n=1 Tax=Mesorhabditis belari TaxID=2138241 RepID=A0AAF3J428_9BILA